MATKPVVQIDSKNFVAVPQGRSERVVRRIRNEDFISQFSGEGIRSPSTFLGYQTLIFPNFSLGLGRERIDSDSARVSGEYRRFWDATCDTRFASGVYLPILEEDSSSTGLEVIRASTSFKGNLWGLWEDGTSTQVLAQKYDFDDDPQWEDGGQTRFLPIWQASTTDTSSSFSHSTTSAANRLLIVCVSSSSTTQATGVTYNGVSLTKIDGFTVDGSNVTAWYLVAPATGSNAVVVSGGNTYVGSATTFYNVDQTTPVESETAATGTSAAPSVVAATAGGRLIMDIMHVTSVPTAAPGDGQTERADTASSSRHAISTKGGNAATVTMEWTLGSSAAWGIIAIPINGNNITGVGLDLISHKTHLVALAAQGDSQRISRSTDGVTWIVPATGLGDALLDAVITANQDIDAGLLADIGGEVVAALWHETNGTITFYSSADVGDNWTDENIDIPSGNGPQGLAALAGIDNEDKLYVGTREGIYEVDTAPSTWTFRLIFPMTSHNDNCRRMGVMADGALWFAQGVDDDTPPIVYRMFVSNGARIIERVPNDFSLGDGLTSDALGPIRWMISADGMVYASAGGGKSARNARIWCHNGKGWHSVRQHGTVNQKIEWIAASSDDDGTPRLHYAVRTGTTAHDVNFLAQAFVNPASGVTIKRESTGIVDLPYVDLSFPLDTKNWLRVGVNADTLTSGTTNQHITIGYGITSDLGALAARNAGDLGDIITTISRLSFGTNGIGADGLVLGLRANINLGDATNTVKPVLKDIQIDALPKPTKTRQYEIIVDIADTAALRGGEHATAAVYTDLETIEDLKVKAVVTYADIGTRYMDVKAVHYDDEIIGCRRSQQSSGGSWGQSSLGKGRASEPAPGCRNAN